MTIRFGTKKANVRIGTANHHAVKKYDIARETSCKKYIIC